MDDEKLSHISLEQANQLVTLLGQGNVTSANELFEELSRNMQQELFEEIGKVTRQLHDSVVDFSLDDSFSSMVNSSLPDAKERLLYVVDMTAKAATQTMDAVDDCIPLAQKHREQVVQIQPSWERLKSCKIKVGEFRELREKLDQYFTESVSDAEILNSKLNEILLAQGFQDLTGQVLYKISDLVQDVEENLINLLKVFGQHQDNTVVERIDNCIIADGPVVPSAKQHDVVSGQDEVDDLLSSLGF
ncbi:MAG: protein phosphatase CheZ [Gammaproteobacteria bacterium]|nr:protein phosphatase CheZ [Gammaproteobacteria bacterium]